MLRTFFLLATISFAMLTPQSFAQSQNQEEAEVAQQKAEEWLTFVDKGNYTESWNQASPLFQQNVTEDQWSQVAKQLRDQLGELESREVQQAQYTTSLPNAPEGEYVVVQYNSEFSNIDSTVETVVMNKTEEGEWAAIGYSVPPPGQ
uniref:DUF4019 domain-containing protein n=1 Tax=Roseihalotalea indica TaxID=2867963 RepID=A0AA49GKX7_9BACT|nr:DUF4019 domain-containing protein [Tunicatimonas sp. TK19036]